MRVYLDNCCYNRPFDKQGDVALGAKCFNILLREVGPVDAERFIAYVNRERMDYTEWQQTLFAGQSIDEIAAQSRVVGARMRDACKAKV